MAWTTDCILEEYSESPRFQVGHPHWNIFLCAAQFLSIQYIFDTIEIKQAESSTVWKFHHPDLHVLRWNCRQSCRSWHIQRPTVLGPSIKSSFNVSNVFGIVQYHTMHQSRTSAVVEIHVFPNIPASCGSHVYWILRYSPCAKEIVFKLFIDLFCQLSSDVSSVTNPMYP